MKSESEIFEFDAIIIGAGIVGLAIAHKLSEQYKNILLIDKESSFGRHISSRNSEVIHSGIYYDPNSLKAKLCLEGNKLLYDFSNKYGINHQNCGKIIISTNNKDMDRLESLMKNGTQNGLEGMELLNSNQVNIREPLIKSVGGLWIPSSGIIDSCGLMNKLEYLIKSHGDTIIYNTEIIDIKHNKDIYELFFKNLDYQATSKVIINSSGLWCDQIAKMIGINDYEVHFCKGEYYKTSKYKNEIQSLIYPLPNDISLGIHAVLHLDGTLGFGPNAYYVNDINYDMDERHKNSFLKHINTFLDLKEYELHEDFTGIRPKIQQRGDPPHDFIITNEFKKGYENFINLIGIESPGLTSSLAIAKYVKKIIH